MNFLQIIFASLIMSVHTPTVTQLQLPVVSDSIRISPEKVEDMLRHFWDDMDFSDPLLISNPEFMEKEFVNFLSFYPNVDENCLIEVTNHFLDSVNVDEKTYSSVYRLAGQYLNSFDSPMRNEDYYIMFLNHAIEKGKLDEADRERAKFRLEMALKNRPGTSAPDFRLVTRGGEEHMFTSLLHDGYNVVMFYDPDCGHCEEVIARLAAEPSLSQTNVIAIDSEEDRSYWEETSDRMPPSWCVGFALDDIQDSDLYVFPEMPTIYVIDGNGTIIMKEAAEESIISKQFLKLH